MGVTSFQIIVLIILIIEILRKNSKYYKILESVFILNVEMHIKMLFNAIKRSNNA